MTNEQILKQAIEKAVKGGFSCGCGTCKTDNYHYGSPSCVSFFMDDYDAPDWKGYIFSHDFAKAFWGEEMVEKYSNDFGGVDYPNWQYHLQQMVLEPEPLKYIEKFL